MPPRSPKAPPRRRAAPLSDQASNGDGRDRRNRILEVATAEFATKGFAGARVEHIAKQAGVNKQLLYYYFGDKKTLYNTAVGAARRSYRASWVETRADSRRYAERMMSLAEHQDYQELTLWSRMTLWESLQNAAASVGVDSAGDWAMSRAEIEAEQDSGGLDSGLDTEMLTLVLVGLLMQPQTMVEGVKALTGHDPADPEFRERHAKLIGELIERLGPPNHADRPPEPGQEA